MKRYLFVGLVGLVLGVLGTLVLTRPAFQARAAMSLEPQEVASQQAEGDFVFGKEAPAASAPRGVGGFGMRGGGSGGGGKGYGSGLGAPPPPAPEAASEPEPTEGTQATVGRAWFPETFLFEPLVVTDEAGEATVPVKVPDRLTRWRVLALGHSRSGAQAGVVTEFSGTLPTYVDPVLPPFLRAGDAVRLPVQVVNTTEAPVTRALKVEAEGAVREGGARTVTVPAAGSVVEYVTLRATRPGPVALRASLGGTDTVVRTFEVWPTGRPVVETRGGTLAAPRTLTLEGPEDAVAGSERVRLRVYPGALGVLREELSAAVGRGGVAEDAYALLLAGRAPELMEALGEEADAEGLRDMAALAGQRVLRAGRAPDVATAALLAEAALAHPDNPVLARLGERLAAQVAGAQRPDGTCQGEDGWTLQRLLVATADCARAVRAAEGTPEGRRRAAAFSVRAAGA
ncbi:MAG TPA: alpha-2-macroglobulin family protein, partial [Myxococcaceae bacterium]|nr:alpha-2-macroglobulin family protein [Myxococcaceae bacterium]